MNGIVGIGIDLTQHVPLVSFAVCPAALRADDTMDAQILANQWPPKLELAGVFHPHVPCAVLPVHSGEPLLIGDAAAIHRRSSGLPWPPEAQVPYGNDTSFGFGRVPLAAAWSALLPQADEKESLTHRSDHAFKWSPEKREYTSYAGTILASSIKAFLAAARVPISSRLTTIVVPDALDEAGQQILLESLAQVGMAADNLHLLPRPLAVALNWCSTAKEPVGVADEVEAGTPIGRLRVLTTALDLWEAVSLELRVRSHAGRTWLLPVRDRARLNAALPELQTPGLSFAIALARAEDNGAHLHWWHRLFASDWLTQRLAAARDLSSEEIQSLREIRSSRPPETLREQLEQIEVLRPITTRLFRDTPSLRDDVARKWQAQERQVGFANYPCKAVLADGALSSLRMERGIPLGQFVVQHDGDPHSPDWLAGYTAAVHGAALAAAAIGSGLPCYRETLLPLDLYVFAKNDYGDLIPQWRELVKTESVEAGRTWKCPAPVVGLQIREKQDRLRVLLRRKLAGTAPFRQVTSELLKPAPNDEPVQINIEVRPGQGFAQVRIDSLTPGLFASRLDWRTMAKCDEPKCPPLAYIPGVSRIIPDREMFDRAQSTLEEVLLALVRNSPVVRQRLREAIKLLNKWPLAHNVEQSRGHTMAKDFMIHYGVIGSEGRLDALPSPELARSLRNAIGEKFASLVRRGAVSSPLGNSLLRIAGWFYIAIPDECLTFLRSRLPKSSEDSVMLSAVELHAIGLSLSQPSDTSRFFPVCTQALRSPKAKPNNYLRAVRNICRFRNDALSPATISDAVLNQLVDELFEIMRRHLVKGGFAPRIVANCLETLLFLLKRRRYDAGFLAPTSSLAGSLIHFLERVSKYHNWRLPPRLQQVGQTTVRFLKMEGTLTDLEDLLSDDQEL